MKNIKITSKFSKESVKEAYNHERDGKIKQRLLIILKAFRDKSSYEVADEVNTSHTKVLRWVKRFNKKGIEGFWSFAKERFRKYHGIDKNNYPFYLKEMEFRFNHRNENVYNLLVNICVRRVV